MKIEDENSKRVFIQTAEFYAIMERAIADALKVEVAAIRECNWTTRDNQLGIEFQIIVK